MHKVLVPIDGSDNAHRALQYALGLAKERSSIELHIVTVHPEPDVYGEIHVTETQMAELQLKRSQAPSHRRSRPPRKLASSTQAKS